MAKQPIEIRDRFRITAEADAEAMGPLLAQLTRMGLQNIGYELITDVVRFGTNGPRVLHDTTGDEFARQWLVEHPTFRAKELIQHFVTNGRSDGSGYTAIRNLVSSRELLKVAPGSYARSDIKAIAPPIASKKAKAPAEPPVERKRKRGQVPKYDVPNLDLIMAFIKRRKRLTVVEVGKYLMEEGRNKKSASPIISKLAAAEVLKQVEPGVYEVVKAPKNASLNGAESHGS